MAATSKVDVTLSGFADETAFHKEMDLQLATFAALGLEYLTIRFVNLGSGVKNVMDLTAAEVGEIVRRCAEHGLKISSLGSPVGKAKLRDVDDGLNAKFAPWPRYLDTTVRQACELANQLGTKLVRGFSFYPPRASKARDYLPETIDRIGAIARQCGEHGLIFGLEVESNLVGHNGELLAEIYQQVGSPHLVLVFDGANLVSQGMSETEVIEQYKKMKPGLGWLHVKDYRMASQSTEAQQADGFVDEDQLDGYVPAGAGSSGYPQILEDFKTALPAIRQRLSAIGLDEVFVDLEPHMRGGGQYGGYSGPDGFGIAFRALGSLLDQTGLRYRLRNQIATPAKT